MRRLVLVFIIAIFTISCKNELTIVSSNSKSTQEDLAAKEVCRYIYQRTGELVPIVTLTGNDLPLDAIIIATRGTSFYSEICPDNIKTKAGELNKEGHIVKTIANGTHRQHYIIGADSIGTLYGAYVFAEKLGVKYALHGDIIPDAKISIIDIPDMDYKGEPLFNRRGILPFHDFPEGPDLWSLDDYKTYFTQMAKLRMNFFTLHCYPEAPTIGPEPTVWLGLPEDVSEDGTVKFSYPAKYASTSNTYSGFSPWPTSKFSAGADRIYENDNFGSPITNGFRPIPTTVEEGNALFNRAGHFFNEAFSFGRSLGLGYCIGTEMPLKIPKALREHITKHGKNPDDEQIIRQVYKGMFTRIARTHPLDYYWLWTSEEWQWGNPSEDDVNAVVTNFRLAQEALDEIGNPFSLASAGWVMGPPADRSLFDNILGKDAAISCISRFLGTSVLNSDFEKVSDRPKWAIPWIEDDVAMTTPQLWAGRMRRDAADALNYGCTGLLGLHWRTKQVAPNVIALANAAWDQEEWNPNFGKKIEVGSLPTDVCYGGQSIKASIEIKGSKTNDAFKTSRVGVKEYNIAVPNGKYKLTLNFSEYSKKEKGKRVFNVKIQGETKFSNVDIFLKVGMNGVYNLECIDINVSNENLKIELIPIYGETLIAGIVINGRTKGGNQIKGKAFNRAINCGGGKLDGYEADLKQDNSTMLISDVPDDMNVDDLYLDWATAICGVEVAEELAAIFASLDGGPRNSEWMEMNMPRPAAWINGPGGFEVNKNSWDKEKERYAFVDAMAALRPKVQSKGNLARFDYWLNSFQYVKAVGKLTCIRGELDALMEAVKIEADGDKKNHLIREKVLPARINLARQWEKMMTHMLQYADTPGEMGTILNLEQHVRRSHRMKGNKDYVYKHDLEIEKILNEKLPEETLITNEYLGTPRIIVPTVRTLIDQGEQLTIKVIVLDTEDAKGGKLYWRPMGQGKYKNIELSHVNRSVYKVTLPEIKNTGIEYYIEAETADGIKLTWPPTSPTINQTIIIVNN